jgi:hypothetical protein
LAEQEGAAGGQAKRSQDDAALQALNSMAKKPRAMQVTTHPSSAGSGFWRPC